MLQQDILDYLKDFKNSSKNKLFTDIGIFGSYAKNIADSYSDIDVAVRLNRDSLIKYDVWDYFDAIEMIKNELFKRFNLKSDIFDLDSISPFKDKIEKEVIYV